MTKIIHEFLNDSISKHSNTNDFLLSNKKGGFFVDNNTIYRGLYFCENEILKTVESIKLGAVKELKNKFYCFERKYSKAKDRLFFDDCFLYEVWDYKGKVKVSLDFRRIHDFRKKSKYKIYDEDNFIIVESENNFLVIKTDAEYEKLSKYRTKEYGAFSKEIYDAFNFKIKEKAKIVFSFSKDKKRAMKKALDMFLNSDKKLRNAEIHFNEMIDPAFENIDKKIKFAYLSAVKSLDNLIINNSIYSGFPSKLQIWTRDELMSLKALMFLNQNDLIKDIILSYVSSIKDDGLLPRYFGAEEGSLESTAWLFLRLRDFVKHLTNVGLVRVNG